MQLSKRAAGDLPRQQLPSKRKVEEHGANGYRSVALTTTLREPIESATTWLVFGKATRVQTTPMMHANDTLLAGRSGAGPDALLPELPWDLDALRALIAAERAAHASAVVARDTAIAERTTPAVERDLLAARNARLESANARLQEILAEIRRAILVVHHDAIRLIAPPEKYPESIRHFARRPKLQFRNGEPMKAELNGHAVGIILKELVRRAMTIIRHERHVFEATAKQSLSGNMDDVFTTADTKAQQAYVKSLGECFPSYTIVAEEGSVEPLVAGPLRPGAFFTVDPLDGTRAFVRRQSHGVGTMVALVEQGQVTSAYIGDINTHEIYGYRPGSHSVHRISEYETSERLTHVGIPVAGQYALLRDPPEAYSPSSRALLQNFKSYEVEGGSIGIWLARLWKREVGAALLLPGVETPWDTAPIVGISKMLGYRFYRPSATGGWLVHDPIITERTSHRDHDLLVIHERDALALALSPSN